MACKIDGESYKGQGKTPMEAKLACAQMAVAVLAFDVWMEMEDPVAFLKSIFEDSRYELVFSSGPAEPAKFVVKAVLNHLSAVGSGESEMMAKLNAIKTLLAQFHKSGLTPRQVTG